MDNFAEQLVKKNETASDKVKRAATVVIGIIAALALLLLALMQLQSPLIATLGIILAVVSVFGTYYLVQSSMVEYEYTFTNGELDVAKIVAQKKRHELLTVDVKKFTSFGKFDDSIVEIDGMAIFSASDNIASHEYYADFQHEEYGISRLIFVPDEKMLGNIRRCLPARLRAELNAQER